MPPFISTLISGLLENVLLNFQIPGDILPFVMHVKDFYTILWPGNTRLVTSISSDSLVYFRLSECMVSLRGYCLYPWKKHIALVSVMISRDANLVELIALI